MLVTGSLSYKLICSPITHINFHNFHAIEPEGRKLILDKTIAELQAQRVKILLNQPLTAQSGLLCGGCSVGLPIQ